jgi:hypothetical protein
MKATTLIALSAMLGTCAFAQDAPKPEGQRPQRQQRQLPPEMLKQFDKDGDGKLNEEETKAMRTEMQAKMEERRKANLEKYDANKDGKLDEEETKKMREDRQKEMLEKYDTDKDGKLSEEERAKIPANERWMGGAGGPGGRQPGGRQPGQGGRGGRGGAPGTPPPPAPPAQ